MTRRRAASASLDTKNLAEIDAQLPGKRIHVFRCNKSGLYAFTADREGRVLPSEMYPEITWRFEQASTFRFDGNAWRDKLLKAMLGGVSERGFHLIHAALYRELLGFITQHSTMVH